MIFRKLIDQLFQHLDAFEIGQWLQFPLVEVAKVFLNDRVAEGVKGMQVDFVCVAADELDQAFAHCDYAGIGKGEAEDVLGLGIGFEQDLADAAGQDLGFSGARSGNDHHWSLNGINRLTLFGVQRLVGFFKLL